MAGSLSDPHGDELRYYRGDDGSRISFSELVM